MNGTPAIDVTRSVATYRELRRRAHGHRLLAVGYRRWPAGDDEVSGIARRLAVRFEGRADRADGVADEIAAVLPVRIARADIDAARVLARSSPLTLDEARALVDQHGPALAVEQALALVPELRTIATRQRRAS